jgi:hypothetical protein
MNLEFMHININLLCIAILSNFGYHGALSFHGPSHFHKSLGISQKNTGKSKNGAEIRILQDKIKTEKSDSERLCHSAVEDCRTSNENLKWYSTMLYLEDGC